MFSFSAGHFLKAFNFVGATVGMLQRSLGEFAPEIQRMQLKQLRDDVQYFGDICESMTAPIAFSHARSALVVLDALLDGGQDPVKIEGFNHVMLKTHLEHALIAKDELADQILLAVPSATRQLYLQDDPAFGAKVAANFPKAAAEIEGASKCMALKLPTAAVFHLMRVMEVALVAVYQCLGLPVPLTGNDRNWGVILNNRIRPAIEAKGRGWAEKDNFQEYAALLSEVKDAWRNVTMHFERTYTQDEAARVFDATRGFMQRIADRMDESGNPRA
ncbi:hypothetical protein [Variovorax paradoxus]|uniref:hypothetical protein n=1 Tax=Variovorax paradoxus TaxID=34073 RepID=UPI003ECECB76